jgi:hypothetical protein
MSTLIPLVLLLAPPTASDRAVDPVDIAAPAPTPAPPPPAAPAANGTIDPFATVQPQPYTAPPPPPPKPAPTYVDRPIRWRVDVFGGVGGELHRDPAWRAFDRDRRVVNLNIGVRADFRLASGRVFLGGGLAFRRFATNGDLYGALPTNLLVRDPLAFLRLSVVAIEGLDVFVQAGGGPSVVRVEFSRANQRSVAALVDGMAGVALYLPKRWLPRRGSSRVTGGLELSAGYTYRSSVDVRPNYVTDEDPISTSSASFGDVAVRGFAWRFGLFIRFQ